MAHAPVLPRTLAEIRRPVAREMEVFEHRFRQAMRSKVANTGASVHARACSVCMECGHP